MAETIEEIVLLVKENRRFKSIDDGLIKDSLVRMIKKYKIDISQLKKRELKSLVKLTRAELRLAVGMFNNTKVNKFQLLDNNNIIGLLKNHTSTKERLEDYGMIKDLILVNNIHSILDLGCGLNPLALADKNIKYYALDINEEDINIVNSFFKKNNISGSAFIYDLKKIDSSLPKVDLCLIFKVFDVLEKKGHKLAEKIIKSINAKYFLISFSTKTLSGKPMNHPQRGWIEWLLKRLSYTFEVIKTKNEIYYFAKHL